MCYCCHLFFNKISNSDVDLVFSIQLLAHFDIILRALFKYQNLPVDKITKSSVYDITLMPLVVNEISGHKATLRYSPSSESISICRNIVKIQLIMLPSTSNGVNARQYYLRHLRYPEMLLKYLPIMIFQYGEQHIGPWKYAYY